MNKISLEKIKNFYYMDDHIATAGQPTVDQFNAIKQGNYDLVINLALAESPNAIDNEDEIVHKLNMDYIHVPVDFNNPTLDDLDKFFNAMVQHQDKQIFVHCALNWRVSAFVFLYKTIKLRIPVDDALLDLQAVWDPDDTWQAFIDSTLSHHNINY